MPDKPKPPIKDFTGLYWHIEHKLAVASITGTQAKLLSRLIKEAVERQTPTTKPKKVGQYDRQTGKLVYRYPRDQPT